MGWALIDHDLWGVTARMSIEFKRPVPIGRRIRGGRPRPVAPAGAWSRPRA